MEKKTLPTVDKEKAQAIAREILRKGEVDDARHHIKRSRNTLYFLAGLFALYAVLYGTGLVANDPVSLIVYSGIAVIYIVLAATTRKNAFTPILMGLIIYSLVIVLNAIADPATILKGLVVKGIIIGFLIKGLSDARKVPVKLETGSNILDADMVSE